MAPATRLAWSSGAGQAVGQVYFRVTRNVTDAPWGKSSNWPSKSKSVKPPAPSGSLANWLAATDAPVGDIPAVCATALPLRVMPAVIQLDDDQPVAEFMPNLKALLKAAAAEAGPVPLLVYVTSTTALPQRLEDEMRLEVITKLGEPVARINSPGPVGSGIWQEVALQPQLVA